MKKFDKELILDKNNIVDVIAEYLPLKRAGKEYKALCPFHQEKTPSFKVSEQKQIYKCFGCGKGGNVISFVKDYEKISYYEALKKLAQRAGIKAQSTGNKKGIITQRDYIFKAYKLAVQYYKKNLQNYGQQAIEYLENRNISKETITKFEIGYALDSFNGLKNHLLNHDIEEKFFAKSGLFGQSNNKLYDLFRNRIMFPIHSITGNIVAFGGRILEDSQKGGKYINSPTTPIYQKKKELYGLYLTRYEISKADFVLVAEGYMDLIRLYEGGFTNVAASLGTALTEQQINLISRYTKNFYMIYDGDNSGKKSAIKAAGLILKNGFNVKIIDMPADEDPDSYLTKHDEADLHKLIETAAKLPTFIKQDVTLNWSKEKKLRVLIDIANQIEDELKQELFADAVSQEFNISAQAIHSRLKKSNYSRPLVNNYKHDSFLEEREIIKKILNDKNSYKKVAKTIDSGYFLSVRYKNLYEIISENIDKIQKFSSFIDELEDDELRNLLTDMMMEKIVIESLEEALKSVKIRKYEFESKKCDQLINQGKADNKILKKKMQLQKKLSNLNKKRVRKTLY